MKEQIKKWNSQNDYVYLNPKSGSSFVSQEELPNTKSEYLQLISFWIQKNRKSIWRHTPTGETHVDGIWLFMTLVLPRCWVWNFSMTFWEENCSNYNKCASTDRGSAECWTPRRTRANLIRAGSRGGELKQTSQRGCSPRCAWRTDRDQERKKKRIPRRMRDWPKWHKQGKVCSYQILPI